jgi:2-keto-4-pentenoate hydratase/2-oxohepta-3-ene-1,7-dioic acid hydratase in catechol pathway
MDGFKKRRRQMSSAPVSNIWAVGRNYAEHAKEMNAELTKTPMFFLKAGSCITTSQKIVLPSWSNDVHHEIELAYLVDQNLNYSHVTLALDLTARDAQSAAKAKGQPWTQAKSFVGACPLGSWIPITKIDGPESLNFSLVKNGSTVQKGAFSNMIFKPDALLAHVKSYFPVIPNDIILTGTPEGVGPLKPGDSLSATLQSGEEMIFTCHWDVI